MDSKIVFFIAMVFLHSSASAKKNHLIYWDVVAEPSLRRDLAVDANIDDFLNILCPQTNLATTDDFTPPQDFSLYNVTKHGYETCDHSDGKLVFVCDLPEQENKLTIKFQTISPSPFGFRFQKCAEYYFIAVKDNSQKGRCNEESERLKIRIGCGDEKENSDHKLATTQKSKTSLTDRIREAAKEAKEEKKDNFRPRPVIPDVVPVTKKTEFTDRREVVASPSKWSQTGENGASSVTNLNKVTTLMMASLTLLWYSLLNRSS